MLLSATSEALARLRVSDLTAAAPCGPSLSEHTGFAAGRSCPRYASGATGIEKLENGSKPEAISEIARLRRSLPEPDPENRAAISIRSARPPIITVIGASPVFRPADCAGPSATSRGARCATRVSLPLDLPPYPIALLAGPARWRWIAQCEGEFVVPLGWHVARRLRDHLLNDQLVLSLLELGFG